MKYHLRNIFCLLAFLTCGVAMAQSNAPTITSRLSADTVMIGDRVTLTVEVEKDVMQHILFPTLDFTRKVAEGEEPTEPRIEVVRDYAPDTIKRDGRRVLLRKRYEMAVYDEGIYKLGRAQVLYLDKNITDTLFADREQELFVKTFPIDSTATTVRDLKPQKNLPLRFGEISGYLAIALGVILVLTGLIFLLAYYMQKRGKHLYDLFKPAPPVPAHIVAIEALEKLRDEKLWQNNKYKQYYSGLSDILRTYIAGRFGVGAMEMTTDEISEALRSINIEQKQKMSLLTVLRDADLVKFAKVEPAAEDNELAYDRSFYFVEETKPIIIATDDEGTTKNSKEAEQ